MEPAGPGRQCIRASVPESEILRYSTDLRSMTAGRGSYTLTFDRYEEVPQHIAQEIIAAKTGGVSPHRLAVPILLLATLLSCVALLLNETIVLNASREWNRLENPGEEITFRQPRPAPPRDTEG